MGVQRPLRQLLDDMRAAVATQEVDPGRLADRAAAMLAGRVGCRVNEARSYLDRLAGEQERGVGEVAADLLTVMESQATPGGVRRARSTVERAMRQWTVPGPAARAGELDGAVGAALVQQVLDALPGAFCWLEPLRAANGEVTDYTVRAASPEAIDIQGRRGSAMIGISIRDAYPSTVDGPIWQAYRDVLADGSPRQVSSADYREAVDEVTPELSFSVRVHALGGGLLVGWVRDDLRTRGADRIAETERLASLGWGEWDTITGEVVWSDQLYRIYERDPALGPLSQEESAALILEEDQHVRVQSARDFAAGEKVDMTYRIAVGGRIKHLRAVIDAVRGGDGTPLRLYGIVQDVTSRELARARLAMVERQLREHQQTLEAEHRLAAQLQQIILPIPVAPIDLPGLRAAVRYLPAERASRVGGDWFHAAAGPDGRVLLAVGDVAGHGLQAATTMAQLRHALAALAVTTTTEPAELLSHLNRLLCASESSAGTATAVVARYDPRSELLTWAQAGHPAPLRARAGATVSLDRPRGPLLGAVPDAVYEEATADVRHGDVLLLYTDGLIEDRERTLEEGLAPVIATLNEITTAQAAAPLAELLDRLRRANPDDDTCILAVRPIAEEVSGRG
jgi:serine phosphatase RsbU (regulator of sigma subunit)